MRDLAEVEEDSVKRHGGNNGKKLAEWCDILAEMIKAVAPIYRAERTSAQQKQLMETTIGAAIWYLPEVPGLWTGMVSLEAILSFYPKAQKTKPKFTEEHQYPRKIAARELLQFNWENDEQPGKTLLELYVSKYGRYNLVTSRENGHLRTYQKGNVFTNPEKAYKDAGINLILLTSEELAAVKKGKRKFIEKYMVAEPMLVAKQTPLKLSVDDVEITGDSVPEFYQRILVLIAAKPEQFDQHIPFATGSKRYLIAREPFHPGGQSFRAKVEHEGFFMETHKSRVQAVKDAARLLIHSGCNVSGPMA